jgi:hypothetical protein
MAGAILDIGNFPCPREILDQAHGLTNLSILVIENAREDTKCSSNVESMSAAGTDVTNITWDGRLRLSARLKGEDILWRPVHGGCRCGGIDGLAPSLTRVFRYGRGFE